MTYTHMKVALAVAASLGLQVVVGPERNSPTARRYRPPEPVQYKFEEEPLSKRAKRRLRGKSKSFSGRA